jgi:hypothetical protein
MLRGKSILVRVIMNWPYYNTQSHE